MKEQEFVGAIYDILEDVVIERSPVIRATYAEAMADARALVKVVNDNAEAFDDELDNQSIGRVDDSYCHVLIDGEVFFGDEVPA